MEKIDKQIRHCRDCRYFYRDDRSTAYTRSSCCFCRRKGTFFSRNYRIGEKTRISEHDIACPDYEPMDTMEGFHPKD